MRRRSLQSLALAAFLLAVPIPGMAGTIYTFRTIFHGRSDTEETGRVFMAGKDARLEWTSKTTVSHRQRPIEIWKEGGREYDILNPNKKTYYEKHRYAAAHASTSSQLGFTGALSVLQVPVLIPGSVVAVQDLFTELTEAGDEPIAGVDCKRMILNVSYRVSVSIPHDKMWAKVSAHAEYWMTETLGTQALPFGHGRPTLETGYQPVDEAVAARLARLRGIALKQVITATRTFAGSKPFSETASLEILTLAKAPVANSLCIVPPHYRYEEPIVVQPKRK